MTIRCKLCRHTFISPKPAEEARDDVLKEMSEHLGKAHRRQMDAIAEGLANLYMLAGPHLLFQHIDVPENESELRAAYDENREKILAILEGRPQPDAPAVAVQKKRLA